MNGDKGGSAVGKMQRASARGCNRDDASEETARRGGAERDDGGRFHDDALGLQPDLATFDLVGVGALVQAPLAAHRMLEMLYRVGDKHLGAGNTRCFQRLVE